MSAHIRLEVAGVRGLLMLLAWRDECGVLVPRRLQPHESGLFGRRYAELEVFDQARHIFTRRGMHWAEALQEMRVPLKALVAFYGEHRHIGGLGAACTFPPWALTDMEALGDITMAITMVADGDGVE